MKQGERLPRAFPLAAWHFGCSGKPQENIETRSPSNWTFCSSARDRELIKRHFPILLISEQLCLNGLTRCRKTTRFGGFDVKFNWWCWVWKASMQRCGAVSLVSGAQAEAWWQISHQLKDARCFSTPLYRDWNTISEFSWGLVKRHSAVNARTNPALIFLEAKSPVVWRNVSFDLLSSLVSGCLYHRTWEFWLDRMCGLSK